jgi:hypothetical protein
MRKDNKLLTMRTLLLIILIAFCISACKKSYEQPSTGIYGKWELHRRYGGYLAKDSTYAAGNGEIYQFNKDDTYKHFAKGKVDAQGVFLIKKESNPPDQPINYILFDNLTPGEPISIDGNKLSIGTTATDGQISEYQKIRN